MDVISKIDDVQKELTKLKKSMKQLIERQRKHEVKSFMIDKSEYEVRKLYMDCA